MDIRHYPNYRNVQRRVKMCSYLNVPSLNHIYGTSVSASDKPQDIPLYIRNMVENVKNSKDEQIFRKFIEIPENAKMCSLGTDKIIKIV
jgi:hypothetical protein